MDKDLIERLASEAMIYTNLGLTNHEVERFAALIAEECAKVCDERAKEYAGHTEEESCSQTLAAAIRARFKP